MIRLPEEHWSDPEVLADWVELKSSQNVACRFLDGCSLASLWFIGFQERFAQDLKRLGERLEWKRVDEGLALNVNFSKQDRSDVPVEIQERIAELNREDVRLYQEAARLWDYPL